jgi:uncharacterized protein YacL
MEVESLFLANDCRGKTGGLFLGLIIPAVVIFIRIKHLIKFILVVLSILLSLFIFTLLGKKPLNELRQKVKFLV